MNASTAGTCVEPMRRKDWDAVRRIYEEGIATGHATFETVAPEWESWDAAHLKSCRLVARADGQVLGWAALCPVSSRCVYAGVAEGSVYVARSQRGNGVGTALLKALIQASEAKGVWTLEAGVFPENQASLSLLRKQGFRRVGIRRRLGQLQGKWRDVVLLERRSERIGCEEGRS